jgi:hypothetical protein
MVRQLAHDLAQRDLQMTKLRQAAEERERALKKMLLDCQVSSLDIESRLRTTDESNTGNRKVSSGKDHSHSPQPEGRDNDTRDLQNSIDEMMNQAMTDDLEVLTRSQSQVVPSKGLFGDNLDTDDERRSLPAKDGGQRSKATMRGWKEYLWSGPNTSRKTSGASSVVSELNQDVERAIRTRSPSNRRRGLQEDLFEPPLTTSEFIRENARRAASSQRSSANGSDDSIRKPSSSITSWALKLVAGTTPGTRENDGGKPLRGRAATTANEVTNGSRRSSNASTKPPSAAKAALRKVNSQATSNPSRRRSGASLSLGPNGTVKGVVTSDGRWQKPSNLANQAGPHSPMSLKDTSESGPVEMDTILPEDSRPPVLTPTYNLFHPSDLLTDNFGFIYDQRQKKKERERAESVRSGNSDLGRVEMLRSGRNDLTGPRDERAKETDDQLSITASLSNVRAQTPESTQESNDAKSTKNWQDYLRAPTFPTELLSHTPSAGVLPTFSTLSAGISDHLSIQGMISNPQSASPAVAGNATLSGSSTPSTIKSQTEPVKMLLEQLTELHDNLQSDKTVQWNDFLRKVRAERRKEDEAAMPVNGRLNRHTMPEISLTDGEMIGVSGLGNKGKVGRAKWKEFKSLVLGGIPVSYRAKIWSECSGASALRVPGYYEDLVNDGMDDSIVASQIAMDIHRTLTDNIFFRKGPGVGKLNEVLLAYARRNPEIGYCQGMNLITASLLLIMPTAEDAFWILTSLVENVLPPNYYDHSLLASRADQQVLRKYVSEILPRLSAHLDELGIELEALTFQWFLSIFTDCLSAEALFRVWDVILCTNDGSTFIFQVALALLKLNERHLLACEAPASVYSYINHQMTNHAISIDGLVQASDALKNVVKRSEMEERRTQAVKAEREATEERARRAKERESKHDAGKAASGVPDIAAEGLATSTAEEDHDESLVDLEIQEPIPIDEVDEAERKLKSFDRAAE